MVVKNPPANAGDTRDVGSIPDWDDPSPVFLAQKIPWTEEPGGLQSMVSQRVKHDCVHTHTCIKQITNKDLLYTTGTSTQNSAMACMGKEFEKEWIYTYV